MAQNPITGKGELREEVADGIGGKKTVDLSNIAAGSNLPTSALASDAGIVPAMIAPAGVQSTPATDLVRVAIATYDFAVDGGAVSTITPAKTVNLPSGAIILGAAVRVITKPDSATHTGTVAIGTSAGSSSTSVKAALVVSDATWNANAISTPVAPVFTVASFVRLTAAGNITVTVATEALTAGKFDIFIFYVVGSAA